MPPLAPKAGSAGVPPARPDDNAGSRSRGYLPHFDRPGLVQMVTFRLADALPVEKAAELRQIGNSLEDAEQRQRLEAYLDAGHGACYLRDARLARLIETAPLHFDGVRYRLLAWVIMPNHVHVLIETIPGHALPGIVHAWKSFTSKAANSLLGRAGRFWQPEYFDRMIRDEHHLGSAVQYLHNNPVKAGLAQRAGEWPFSSAARAGQIARAGETPALPGMPVRKVCDERPHVPDPR